MRRTLAAIGLTVTALVFVLRFNTETGVPVAAAQAPQPGAGSIGSSVPGQGTTATAPPAVSASPGGTVFEGPVVQTRWGPVQVEITVDGTSLVDVEALQLPGHARRSAQISNYVAPIFRQAALQAQSAQFRGVSGATVTWSGYVDSLQAALDEAGL